jgi:hypothetical protein
LAFLISAGNKILTIFVNVFIKEELAMQRLIVLLIFVGSFFSGYAQSAIPIPGDFCLTKDEYKLYDLINSYRKQFNQPEIPLSTSLSFIAKIHVRDLFEHRPDTSYCNMNSWSDKGPWTPCCHSKFSQNPGCILNKPRELTKYLGEGHELSYWDSQAASPDTVFNFWLSIEDAKNLILNQKKWSAKGWQALGVGIFKGYASVWVGDVVDSLGSPVICDVTKGDVVIVLPERKAESTIATSSTGRYYIIVASLKSMEDARKELKKFSIKGFSSAKIIVKEGMYRISISDYTTVKGARDAREKLGEEYKSAWILKY